VRIAGVVSAGQDSIHKAIKTALKNVPHQLGHFPYLRETSKPIAAANRHAQKELNQSARPERIEEAGLRGTADRAQGRGPERPRGQADLPRTDNDREQRFGAHRYPERRCRGQKVARLGLVVRGSVRLPSAVATRLPGEVKREALTPSDPEAWRTLRAGLERRQAVRAQGRCFAVTRPLISKELEDVRIKGTLPSEFFWSD
jgi:hypothetical protein